MPLALLPDRAVLSISGSEARHFLHNVVTCEVESLAPGDARFGALLTPQGKIIADFLLYGVDTDRVLMDVPAALAEDVLKRLTLYRLRARIALAREPDLSVAAAFGDEIRLPEGALTFEDPRLPALGRRLVVPEGAVAPDAAALAGYEAHRIALGIPKGGADFVYGDAFPHETDMDQLHGVDFHKGCYVGQEVVSRMQHRGTARTRIVIARFDAAPAAGVEVMAGEKPAGRMGSAADGIGLAMVRLDRIADARAAGLPVRAGGVDLSLETPAWAQFSLAGPA